MATVSLENINKVYENGFHAVKDLSVDIAEGEFMVLVGPSGCGKSTALRMIAGLEDITSGILRIGGKEANDETPKERDIAMVFQNYALYPHMTVAENIGFALKLRKLPKDQLNAKVKEAAEILGLTDWIDRKPGQLSGGQRQRVAMGRAIVREPSVFLMDEPLSNLDAKLRVQMRAEVSRIQRRIGVATVYVTHDQVEAMTMGDRVTVLRDGILQQCDTPQNLYDNPDNVFVAAFIGSPSQNLYDAALTEGARSLKLGSQDIPLPDAVRQKRPALASYAGKDVVVGMRPEHLPAAKPGDTGPTLVGDVDLIEALGSEQVVHFTIDAHRVIAEGALEKDEAEAVGAGEGVARVEAKFPVKVGDRMTFALEGSAFIAGAAVQWLRDGLGIIQRAKDIEDLARKVASSDGVVFVPALAGLGAPYWDQDARGSITGLTRGTTAAHLARATLEGIALQVRDLLEAMAQDAHRPLRRLRVDGGAAANDLLMQLQADLADVVVERPSELESTGRGAAMLAALGAGVHESLEKLGAMAGGGGAGIQRFEPHMGQADRVSHLGRWKDALERAVVQHLRPHARHNVIEQFDEIAEKHGIDPARVKRFRVNDNGDLGRLRGQRKLENRETGRTHISFPRRPGVVILAVHIKWMIQPFEDVFSH